MTAFQRIGGIILATTLFFTLSSCNGKEKPEATAVSDIVIESTHQGKFVYFSFEKGVLALNEEEAKKSLDWDLAFRWFYPRTNGGQSGSGKAAVMKTGHTNIDAVTTLPTGEWTEDATFKAPMVKEDGTFYMPPKYEEITGNTLLKTWMKSSGRPPHEYDNSVFIIRTAKGDLAKIQLLSFEKEGKSGYITMRYLYPFTPNKK